MFPAAPGRPPGSSPERSLWPFLLVAGLLAFAGVGLLAVGAVWVTGTSSFNQACAENPSCTPAPNYGGTLEAAGAGLIVAGIVIAIVGPVWRRSTSTDGATGFR